MLEGDKLVSDHEIETLRGRVGRLTAELEAARRELAERDEREREAIRPPGGSFATRPQC